MKRRCVSIVICSVLAATVVFILYPARYAALAQSSTPSNQPLVDFPSLVRKSTEEIESLFGKHVEISYDRRRLEPFCQCDEARRYKVKVGRMLWVGFRKDRAVSFSYVLDARTAHKRPELETPEEMLLLVGLDVHGVPPSQKAQTPLAGASSGPFGSLIGGKHDDLLWTGKVSGIDWDFILVGGFEYRGSGSMLRPKNWRVIKQGYHQVLARVAEAL